MKRLNLILGILAVSVLAFSSCKKDDSNSLVGTKWESFYGSMFSLIVDNVDKMDTYLKLEFTSEKACTLAIQGEGTSMFIKYDGTYSTGKDGVVMISVPNVKGKDIEMTGQTIDKMDDSHPIPYKSMEELMAASGTKDQSKVLYLMDSQMRIFIFKKK